MEEHVYPNEPALPARTTTPTLVESLRARRRRSEGLWAPHVPPEARRHRPGLPRLRAPERGDRPQSSYAQLVFGCQAPDAGNAEILHLFGTEEQKERWLRPLVAGEVRSFFSMTEPDVSGVGPDDAAHAARARRRRVGDRRAQVVLVGRRRRGVRDRDGGHRPGRRAARAGASARSSSRPTRRASRSCAPIPVHGARRPRLVDALRGAVHGRARAGDEHARRARRRLPDRAEAARARAGSTTSCAGSARCSARSS